MYEVGEIVEVIGNSCSHGFKIGEKVRITGLNRAEYLNGSNWWCIENCDIKKIEEKYKVGEVVQIIGNISQHQFDIGESVRITEVNNSNESSTAEYLDGRDFWYLMNDDIQKIEVESE